MKIRYKHIIFVIAFAILSYSVYAACCLNPLATEDAGYCRAISQDLCCPDTSTYYEYYYPYQDYTTGPRTQTECQASYYRQIESCSISSLRAFCEDVVCCTPKMIEDNETADSMKRGACEAKGGTVITNPDADEYCAKYSGGPTPPTGTCGISPQFTDIKVRPDKGQKSFTILWTENPDCQAQSYTIKRKKGDESFITIVADITEMQYIDSSEDLLFDQDYEYKIVGDYSNHEGGSVAESDPVTANLGNIECWRVLDDAPFCLNPTNLNRNKQHILANKQHYQLPDANSTHFQQAIEESDRYATKLNKAYKCERNNLLSFFDDPCEGQNGICYVRDNITECGQSSQCQPDTDSSPFGLFSTRQDCSSLSFCYPDNSYTIVDKCYECENVLNCYDYKSRDSCQNDYCSLSDPNECEWKDIIPEFGVGMCIQKEVDNCEWCDKISSTGESEAYNFVLSTCTQNKAQLLSTGTNHCYYFNGEAKSCDKIACNQLDACAADVTLYPNNTISSSADNSCGIGVCEYMTDGCRKNADGDDEPDCNTNNDTWNQLCESDHFAPVTEAIRDTDEGLLRGIELRIRDRIPGGAEIEPYGYLTHFCVEQSDSDDCSNFGYRSMARGDIPFSTIDNYLEINGLDVFQSSPRAQLTSFEEGNVTLYYFTEDPYKNLGEVGSITFKVSEDFTYPVIEDMRVSESTFYSGGWITKSNRPKINITFAEPGANLIKAVLRSPDNTIKHEYSFVGTGSFTRKKYALTLNVDVDEGDYILDLIATNEDGIGLRSNQKQTSIKVDYTGSLATIIPPPPQLLNTSSFRLNISYPPEAEINLMAMELSGQDFTTAFNPDPINQPQYISFYQADLTGIKDGLLEAKATGKDVRGNLAYGFSQFIVNAEPKPVLELATPTNGVSPTSTTNITFRTDNLAYCKYSPNYNINTNQGDENTIFETSMTNFEEAGYSYTHSKSINIGATSRIYVWCKDYYWSPRMSRGPFKYDVFNLRVDTTPPVISVVNPEMTIAEYGVDVSIKIESDEPVICKYSTQSTNYNTMESAFPDYVNNSYKSKTGFVQRFYTNAVYTYQIACENEAGLVSTTRTKTITVNNALPLEIHDHTEKYQGESQPIIAFEVNRLARCTYSSAPGFDTEIPPIVDNPLSRKFKYPATLSSGTFSLPVNCTAVNDPSLKASKNLIFTIDLTPPDMQYVNDTSRLYNHPEFTPYRDAIYVKWLAVDNQTGFINNEPRLKYNFSLEEEATGGVIINWTPSSELQSKYFKNNRFSGYIEKDHNGKTLNLTDDTEYVFRVKAGNPLDLWSTELYSDGVTTDFSLDNDTCNNGIKDDDETDEDCGGACGPNCDINDTCSESSDCSGDLYCDEDDNVCKEPDCDDGIENGDETDTDCGGSDCAPCPDPGDGCKANSDCEDPLVCRRNECSEPDSCSNGNFDSGETDTDCGGVCPKCCAADKYCDTDSDCCQGMSCTEGICKSSQPSKDEDSDSDGIPDWWELQNGLDPDDPADADFDDDDDGLTNYEEYTHNTDPQLKDTDGDGYSDGDEVNKYDTDPTNPDDKPSSSLWIIMLIIIIIIVLCAIGYLLYTQYYQPKRKKPLPQQLQQQRPMMMQRRPPTMSVRTRAPPALQKLRDKKDKKRTSIFDSFESEEGGKDTDKKEDDKKEATKEETKADTKKEYIDLTKNVKIKQPRDDVFKRLSGLISDEDSAATNKRDEDSLKKLSQLSKKTTKEIKQDIKSHTKKVDSKISSIEKKVGVITKPEAVYATPAGTKYHKSNCIVIKDSPKSKLKRFKESSEAKKKKLKPCSVCMPK